MSQSSTARKYRLMAVHFSGFKAIADMSIPIEGHPMSLLVGPNGAGKTSVLQALGFIRHFIEGKPQRFFEHHGWEPATIISHIEARRNASFVVTLALESPDGWIGWSFGWNLASGRCFYEAVAHGTNSDPIGRELLRFKSGSVKFDGWDNDIAGVSPEGSILSFIKLDSHPNPAAREALEALRDWAEGVVSLELLSPETMRRRNARGKVKDIGTRGERLGAFLASLPGDAKQRILDRLSPFYRQLSDLTTTTKKAGWIDLKIAELYRERTVSVGSEHVSDGFLRLLALAALPEFPKSTSLVLLDEAENGIDPLILPDFLSMISAQSEAQIIMTTHSPILVNHFLPEAIHLVGRAEEGQAICVRLSDIPEFKAELEYRGAGDIWAHSSLDRLSTLVRGADQRIKAKAEAEAVTKKAK